MTVACPKCAADVETKEPPPLPQGVFQQCGECVQTFVVVLVDGAVRCFTITMTNHPPRATA